MNTPTLPALLAANPRLDQWVGFPSAGHVTVSTGRVEIGQGVLTAMLQIAAEELDVAPGRILLQTGDTDLTPNEGYTAGSQSIQFGGVALRMACAEVRSAFLDHAATSHGYSRADLAVRDSTITIRGEATGHDYWSLAADVDLRPRCHRPGSSKTVRATTPSSGKMRRESTLPRRCSVHRSLSMTWFSTAWCMRASCASRAGVL